MNTEYYKKYEPIFNSWYIKSLLGEGSFGKVFEIERQDFGVTYKAALKAITIPQNQSEIKSVMADGMDEASATSYFRQVVEDIVSEFVLMSKLKGNSNIVSYEDHIVLEHTEGIGWDILIRMELLTPLIDHIHKEKLSRKDVIKLGIDLCKALELCQKYNIVHRDIKPENIFISDNGDYKLGDFGIARTLEKTSGALSKKGTYVYMAPEIYRDDEYGSNVDIYSLGIVMFRLLNENRTPFLPAYPAPITHKDREAAIKKRISGAVLPRPANADGRLAEIVLKACAYDPKDRYFSPMEMREELEAILYNKEEAKIIYPKGDETPIKSIEYIETGQDIPSIHSEDKTDLLIGSISQESEKTEGLVTHRTVDKTESVFGTKDEIFHDNTASVLGANEAGFHDSTVSIFDQKAQSTFEAPMQPSKKKIKTSHKKGKRTGVIVIGATVVIAVALGGLFTLYSRNLENEKENKYQDLIEQASTLYVEDFNASISILDEAIALKPEKAEAHYRYAYALYINGKYDECIEYINSNQSFSTDDKFKLILASSYFEIRDYENSGKIYYEISTNNAVDLNVENLRDYAVCLGRMGRLDEAATIFVMLTDKGATADVTDYVLGESYYAKGDYTNAEVSFINALSKAEDSALVRRIYMSLAEVYRESNDYNKSIEIIEEALSQSLQFSNSSSVLYEMLGASYYARAENEGNKNDYARAATYFENVIDLGITNSYLYVNVYSAYIEAEDYTNAKYILTAMETVYPRDYTANALRATVLIIEENNKDESNRNYTGAYDEYQIAKEKATSRDDQTQLMQLEGLIDQLRSGGWLN
jgi:serine/threonine protein kinase